MKILRLEKFAFSSVLAILAVCVFVCGVTAGEMRFVIGGILLCLLAIVGFYSAFRGTKSAEMIEQYADERDRFVAMKSATASLKILNFLFFTAGFVLVCLFGVTKESSFLAAGAALWTGIGVMAGTLLVMNLYYEKRL